MPRLILAPLPPSLQVPPPSRNLLADWCWQASEGGWGAQGGPKTHHSQDRPIQASHWHLSPQSANSYRHIPLPRSCGLAPSAAVTPLLCHLPAGETWVSLDLSEPQAHRQ